MTERRNFPRQEAAWQADIYTGGTIFTSTVNNLSLGGAELIRPSGWDPKQNHLCKISFSDNNSPHPFEIQMKICWVSDACVGLNYHDMKMGQKIKLNKILSNMAREAVVENNHCVIMQ